MEESLDAVNDTPQENSPEILSDDETAQIETEALESMAAEAAAVEQEVEEVEAAAASAETPPEKPYTVVVAFGIVDGHGVLTQEDVTLWASDLTKLKLPVRWLMCTDKNLKEVVQSVINDINQCADGSLEKK